MLSVDIPERTRLHMLNDVLGDSFGYIGFDKTCMEAGFSFDRALDAAQPCRGAAGFSLPNNISFLEPLLSISYMFYVNGHVSGCLDLFVYPCCFFLINQAHLLHAKCRAVTV